MAHVRHMLHTSQQNNKGNKSSNGRVLLLTLPNQTTHNSANLAMPFKAPPKLLIYSINIKFAEFKRCCGEKLSIACTRIFTLSGGEVDTVNQLEKDDTLICTSGEQYIAPSAKIFENKYRAAQKPPSPTPTLMLNRINSNNNNNTSTNNNSGTPHVITNVQNGAKPVSALNRFKSVVRKVQKNRGKHMGTTSRTPSSSTVIVPVSNNNNMNNMNTMATMQRQNDNNSPISKENDIEFGDNTDNGIGNSNSKSNGNENNTIVSSWSSHSLDEDDQQRRFSQESVEGRRRSSVWDTRTSFEKSRDEYKKSSLSVKSDNHGVVMQYLMICWQAIRSKFIRIEGGTSEEDPVREVFAPPLVYPEHPYRLAWDSALTLLVIFYALVVPLRLAFPLASPSYAQTIFDIICSFLFIIDIGLNFCTAIKLRGSWVTDHKIIAKVYLKSWFIIDLVSSMPIDLVFLGQDASLDDASVANSVKMLKGLRIFKLLRVLRLQRIINRLETHHHVDPSFLRMGKLIGILITTWHWLGCSYWFVAELEFGNSRISEDAWIPPSHVWQSIHLGPQYAFSFFWAVVVTSGIGWDIIPSTSLQIVFTTFAIVTGLLIYAIIIGSASTLLANIDSQESERKNKMNEVKSLLRNRHVPKMLSSEIFEFYEYLLSCNNSSIDEYSILSELPQSLRSRLNIAINRQIIKSIPVFGNCTDSAMARLIEQLYQLVILPGEYVMEQNMPGNEMYFVVRGKLQVLRDTELGHRITMAKRGEGDFFGELALFEDQPRGASVKAITYCDLLTLPREGFEYLKIHFPSIIDTMRTAGDRRKKMIATIKKLDAAKIRNGLKQDDTDHSGSSTEDFETDPRERLSAFTQQQKPRVMQKEGS